MKRFLLAGIAVLLLPMLAACFPTPTDAGTASLLIENQITHSNIIFASGTLVARDVKLEVYAIPPRVNDSKCRDLGTHLECALGDIPAGKRYVLPATGPALTARATYRRDSGAVYTLIAP